MRRTHRRLIVWSLVIGFGGLAAPIVAQFRLNGARVEVPPARPSVYVRDSAIAAEKLALAQRMERLKEWNKSADVYQEIIEKYADRVVPVEDAAEIAGTPTRYSSVTFKVQSLLGKWPEEGLAVYRARYETPAAAMLDETDSDDVGKLNQVVQRYFPTDAARKAALRLMELYIENGEFSAAAWLGERLLIAHPALATDRANVLFRTALAQHMAGDAAAAKMKLDDLKSQHADATGRVMGKDVVLAEEAAKLLAQKPPVARDSVADSWPTFGGDVTRGRVPNAAGKPGAKVAEAILPRDRPRPIQTNPELRAQVETWQKNARELGLTLTIMPVVDRGELFFQDNSRIHAVSVDTGRPLPGWAMLYGTDNRERFESASRRTLWPQTSQLSVTVTDSSVLAVLRQADASVIINDFGGFVQSAQSPPLVCVDRTTGARKWSTSPSQFPESMANLKSLKMNGSPLVVGDSVYVAARGGKPQQFEDAYVLCFALGDGKLRWACYLASGNASDMNFGAMRTESEAVTHLAHAGGRVYAVTNLGAVASVDAYTGTIAWLNIYPKPQQPNNPMFAMAAQGPGQMSRQRKPWAQNPAIVREGKIFALPSDSANVLIYDAATGEEFKRISMSDFENANTLLGVTDDKLVVANINKVYCIDWRKHEAGDPMDSLHWISKVGGTDDEKKDVIRGRAFLTADSVFAPTIDGLRRISLDRGRIEESYPRGGPWPTGEGPGNLIVTQDQVIIAGADKIVVYSDLLLARTKLDKSIADAPSDPMPRLKYADTLFAAGEFEAAIAKLDEAIALLGGLNSMRPGTARAHVFATALTFAEQSADPKVGATDVPRVNSLYDRAAAAADVAQQQVSWRLSRARFARTRQDFSTEVRLYQEILSQPKLRGVGVPADNNSGIVLAASVAENAIGDRLKSHPVAYAPFERQASEALTAAKASNDPNQVLAVAQTYPNAKVAPDAMFAAADLYEAAGKHRPATGVLNQLYLKYGERADKPRILEAQARNYLALPNGVEVAIGRLTEGIKIGSPQLSRPLKLPDGSTIEGVSFGAAAELLQKYSAELAAATLPEFKLPITAKGNVQPAFAPKSPESVIPDVDQLVLAPRELRSFARYDRVVTWTQNKGVGIYAIGANQPLAESSAIMQPPRGGAWLSNDLLVWTNQKIALLRGDGGATAWETDIATLPALDIAAADADLQPQPVNEQQERMMIGGGAVIIDNQVVRIRNGRIFMPNGVQVIGAAPPPRRAPGGPEAIDHIRPVGDRVVIATSTGRIAAIELSSGQIAWQSRVTDVPLQQAVTNDDFVAVRFMDSFGAQIVALETFTGQIVWRRAFAPDAGQYPVNMIFSPDGTLLFTVPDRLCGVDLYAPGKGLKFGEKPGPDMQQVFAGCDQPDHLVVSNGRVLALADNGTMVRVLSVDDGREIPRLASLSTGATGFNVQIRVVGPRIYIVNPRTVLGYTLDRPSDNWTGSETFGGQSVTIRDAFLGKKHVVLLAQPTEMGAVPPTVAPHFRLIAYARYSAPGQTIESHKIDQLPDITHPAGIEASQWQPVDGGFYFRSADRQAHFLKGAATEG